MCSAFFKIYLCANEYTEKINYHHLTKSCGLFSDVGVSQEFESELKLSVLLHISRIFRRFARSPAHGLLNPMSESIGRSFGGSTGLITSADEDKFSGKKSAVMPAMLST